MVNMEVTLHSFESHDVKVKEIKYYHFTRVEAFPSTSTQSAVSVPTISTASSKRNIDKDTKDKGGCHLSIKSSKVENKNK